MEIIFALFFFFFIVLGETSELFEMKNYILVFT